MNKQLDVYNIYKIFTTLEKVMPCIENNLRVKFNEEITASFLFGGHYEIYLTIVELERYVSKLSSSLFLNCGVHGVKLIFGATTKLYLVIESGFIEYDWQRVNHLKGFTKTKSKIIDGFEVVAITSYGGDAVLNLRFQHDSIIYNLSPQKVKTIICHGFFAPFEVITRCNIQTDTLVCRAYSHNNGNCYLPYEGLQCVCKSFRNLVFDFTALDIKDILIYLNYATIECLNILTENSKRKIKVRILNRFKKDLDISEIEYLSLFDIIWVNK